MFESVENAEKIFTKILSKYNFQVCKYQLNKNITQDFKDLDEKQKKS